VLNTTGMTLKIIGIDPGYDRCGFAVLTKHNNKLTLSDFGVIKTSPDDIFYDRQAEVSQDFASLLETHKPDIVAVEDLFFATNTTTALKVAQIRGILINQAYQFGCRILEPKPVELKSHFCGNGKADKKAMMQMAQLTFNLKDSPQIDDAADAIAAAHFGAFQRSL